MDEPAAPGMTVAAVASATGYSAQQIRDLERLGVLGRAVRAANGYRQFAEEHVRDLHAYRDLSYAVGPVAARDTMTTIRRLALAEAAALVCDLPAQLNQERAQALAARAALQAIQTEASIEDGPRETDAMTITELSGALGLRPSTLRFWEDAGLLRPERIATRAGTARRYHLDDIRAARIAVALRAAGYRIPDVRNALAAISELGAVDEPLVVLNRRLAAIGKRAVALIRATATLADIIDDAAP
ncbi:DNA-binding transcriptional MerR regulator [Tamaricihabitans halophyticus]|uniref:DNA-binding transcriptional MerR regulator n=1 Tax=Tamaricihabitans halophyticus TaxID=1262583 RepID=A0A4R2R553_9PSEU|nr:MerR family transcriptional regulator [Tamaricihabitans halophyticus]TCP57157.1 DNA-binding transcriptional MerR regulator [Tamaricihabitans halophyticus]